MPDEGQEKYATLDLAAYATVVLYFWTNGVSTCMQWCAFHLRVNSPAVVTDLTWQSEEGVHKLLEMRDKVLHALQDGIERCVHARAPDITNPHFPRSGTLRSISTILGDANNVVRGSTRRTGKRDRVVETANDFFERQAVEAPDAEEVPDRPRRRRAAL